MEGRQRPRPPIHQIRAKGKVVGGDAVVSVMTEREGGGRGCSGLRDDGGGSGGGNGIGGFHWRWRAPLCQIQRERSSGSTDALPSARFGKREGRGLPSSRFGQGRRR
ncbi:hypothetical protein OsI_12564 [Oryza sativa Indica Group]|uniref:Uncharacterized protein n=1 Tax=Oryza sativa subsp. indica TaxID=39946 RepID=B8AM66_ORYSI|nr:hypothetical protein OsI_12564 [Oryza sativa Indica Group]